MIIFFFQNNEFGILNNKNGKTKKIKNLDRLAVSVERSESAFFDISVDQK